MTFTRADAVGWTVGGQVGRSTGQSRRGLKVPRGATCLLADVTGTQQLSKVACQSQAAFSLLNVKREHLCLHATNVLFELFFNSPHRR